MTRKLRPANFLSVARGGPKFQVSWVGGISTSTGLSGAYCVQRSSATGELGHSCTQKVEHGSPVTYSTEYRVLRTEQLLARLGRSASRWATLIIAAPRPHAG